MAKENSSPKRITGRPTKLTPEKQEEIVKYLRAGNYVETAAAYAGLSKASVYNWMRRGRREIERVEDDPRRKVRKEEQPYVDFLYAIEKAQAGAEMTSIALINRASETQWQAAAWRLERKHPDRWGRKTVPDEEQKLRNEMLEMELKLAKLKIKQVEEEIRRESGQKGAEEATEQVSAIADLINNPDSERVLSDFMGGAEDVSNTDEPDPV